PYATIPAELWLSRSGRLAGQWRTGEPDPSDRLWYDGLLRWFLLRPWVLAVLIFLAVVTLFTVLLIIGPPGGRCSARALSVLTIIISEAKRRIVRSRPPYALPHILAAATAVAHTGCADDGADGAPAARLQIVGSTNVYGGIAAT